VGKQACQSPLTRRLPGTTSRSAGRDCRFADEPAVGRLEAQLNPDVRTNSLPTAHPGFPYETSRRPIFAYHGYPSLIHRLTYRRRNHANLHVRGYNEEGTTTTPFDMVMLNDMDRFHLVIDVVDRVPGLGATAALFRQQMADERLRHRAYTREVGDDMPDVRDWAWPFEERGFTPTDAVRGRPA
jgi:phosphoketolase